MRESDWIQHYIAPLVHAPGAARLRDDVATLSMSGPTIVSMDTLTQGTHFLADDPLDTVGQKLVRVNASDIIAKGAEPVEALLSVAWPENGSESDFAAFMNGLGLDLEQFGIALIGGDLVRTSGPLTLTLTLTGRCLNEGPVRRSGGAAGQSLLINGEIGWGGLGLDAAKKGGPADLVQRYRVPRIGPIAAAGTIAKFATASMDVSDGLLIDVARLAAASGCGAHIHLESVPLAQVSENAEEILAQCTSGDDYCALISAGSGMSIPGFTVIGSLTPEPGLQLTHQGAVVNTPSTLGFEH
ncbi:MAG: thiamine-phosphate kinase [Pseudomonadota bacterium]